jgi:cell division protein FtsB
MAQPPEFDLLKLTPRRRDSRWLQKTLLWAMAILLADGLFGDRGLRETLRASERYVAAVRELNAIRQENSALKDQARRLTRDPGAIEAEARRQLGLLRRGEFLFVVHTR